MDYFLTSYFFIGFLPIAFCFSFTVKQTFPSKNKSTINPLLIPKIKEEKMERGKRKENITSHRPPP